jgi:hypothetical protein
MGVIEFLLDSMLLDSMVKPISEPAPKRSRWLGSLENWLLVAALVGIPLSYLGAASFLSWTSLLATCIAIAIGWSRIARFDIPVASRLAFSGGIGLMLVSLCLLARAFTFGQEPSEVIGRMAFQYSQGFLLVALSRLWAQRPRPQTTSQDEV